MFALGNNLEPPPPPSAAVVRSARHSRGRSSITPTALPSMPLCAPMTKTAFEVPLSISKRFRDVQFKTLVGLAPTVPAAWYSVDDSLHLWNFTSGESCVIRTDGVVTAVGVGLPTPGVFPPGLFQHLVCVATENSVSLTGLTADLKQVSLEGYFLPLTFFSQVHITLTGLVFLWSPSDPTSLSELRYRASSSWFRNKLYMHTHSLLVTSGSSSYLANVWKLQSLLFAPKVSRTDSGTKVFIGARTFRYFVSVDSVNLNLHEITPHPTSSAVQTAAWRHACSDSNVSIACVARISLADPAISGSVTPRVLDVRCGCSRLSVVTDFGELLTLEQRGDGSLFIAKSHKVGEDVEGSTDKKFRSSLGTGQRVTGPSCTAAVFISDSSAVTAHGGTWVSGASSQIDVGGSVLGMEMLVPIEADSYGSFVAAGDSSRLIILTGKGVSVIDTQSSAVPSSTPTCVSEAVKILSAPASVLFGFKTMLVRALGEDVSIPSLASEQEFACRQAATQPLSASVWIGGVRALFDSLIPDIAHQPVLAVSKSGLVRVAIAQAVLERLTEKLANVSKFVKVCLHAAGCDVRAAVPTTAWGRREFLHGKRTRTQLANEQATNTLARFAEQMGALAESAALFGLVSAFQSTAVSEWRQASWTLVAVSEDRSILRSVCERLLQINSGNQDLIEKLKVASPSILCSVAPSAVPFSAMAAMLHCALQSKSWDIVLETVQALARNTPSVAKSLNDVAQIVKTVAHADVSTLMVAYLEGLQSRLMDEGTVVLVLNWAGSHMSAAVNESVLSFLFQRGFTCHVHAASANPFVEKFLASHLADRLEVGICYATLLAQTGRQQQAGDVLEQLALGSHTDFSIFERISLLEKANAVFSTNKRFDLWAIARYVQVPLLLKEEEDNEQLESQILPIGTMFPLTKPHPELQLISYLFAPSSDAEIMKTWVKVMFGDFAFFRKTAVFFPSSASSPANRIYVSDGVVAFLEELYEISSRIDSFDVWKKMDVVVALAEYVCVMTGAPGSYVKNFLSEKMQMGPTQIVELYMKIVREMSKWVSKIPKGITDYPAPSTEKLEAHFVDIILACARKDVANARIVSLLTLLRNYLKHDDPARVQILIDELSLTKGDCGALPGI